MRLRGYNVITMLKKKNQYVVAVAGATGAVGREMIEILEERKFPIAELVPLHQSGPKGRGWNSKAKEE